MKVLVVDDEKLARERVISLLKNHGDHEVSIASSGREALDALTKDSFELVFLDIQMTDMTGFDVLMRLDKERRPPVIFVTAYDHFAIKAFEVNAVDFLLKPFREERFFESIERIEGSGQRNLDSLMNYLSQVVPELQKREKGLESIVIKNGNNFYFINTEDVKYITSSAYYAEIFTMDGKKHIHRISMTDFIKVLGPDFIRVNRSSILNIGSIERVVSEGMGDYSIVMQDGNTFQLSKNYKMEFMHKMKIK
jgi:two-component system LytT family response regulator